MNGCFSAGAVPHTKWVFDWARDESLFACPTKKGGRATREGAEENGEEDIGILDIYDEI